MPIPRIVRVSVINNYVIGGLAGQYRVAIVFTVMEVSNHPIQRGKHRHTDVLLRKSPDQDVRGVMRIVGPFRTVPIHNARRWIEIEEVENEAIPPDGAGDRLKPVWLWACGSYRGDAT